MATFVVKMFLDDSKHKDRHENLSEIVKEYKQLEQSLKESHEKEINQLKASFSQQIRELTMQIQDLENEIKQYKILEKMETTSKEDIKIAGDACTKLYSNTDPACLEITTTQLLQHQNQQSTSDQVLDAGTVVTSSSESCHRHGQSSCPSLSVACTAPQLLQLNITPPPSTPIVSNEEVKPPPPPPPPFLPPIPMCPPPPPGPVEASAPGGPPPPPPGVSVLLQKQGELEYFTFVNTSNPVNES
ncbi:hypothetical protein BsWGS_15526 [Bradybaena similaris]